jgi:aspartate/tyrosine/aromatic aminotransferase
MPDDPLLSLPAAVSADPRPNKVNLGVGAYRTAIGDPLVLTAVTKAESILFEKNLNKEYLPIEGDCDFLTEALKLVLGKDSEALSSMRFYALQTIGASGALRLGGEFLALNGIKTLYLSDPSWQNHMLIFSRAGLNVVEYPYYDYKTHRLDFTGMCDAISSMPPNSVILLQACCHNPTGVDPTFEQWKTLSNLIKKQHLIPFFDIAYQGFGKDPETDAKAIRYFLEQGHELLLSSSFSKNFGLYGERIGFLCVVAKNRENAHKIGSQLKVLVRGNYSSPPEHGARIIATILQSEGLTHEWKVELANMAFRVQEMRVAFIDALLAKETHRDFSYMIDEHGMFTLLGLTPEQVQRLRDEKAIYMPNNGRVNIAGLNMKNLYYVVDSIAAILK